MEDFCDFAKAFQSKVRSSRAKDQAKNASEEEGPVRGPPEPGVSQEGVRGEGRDDRGETIGEAEISDEEMGPVP